MKHLFQRVSKNWLLATIALWASVLVPNINKLKKYRNTLRVAYSINRAERIASGNPLMVRIAPITLCNYRCLFCEIHKDDLLYPRRSKNIISLDHIKNYEALLSTAYVLSFFGGSEEPLLNRYMGDIVTYLKKKFGITLMVTTNASTLNKELADIFVEHEFDHILVSYHAGTEEGYKHLMTGNVNSVDNNLLYLVKQKEAKQKSKPVIDFNFALQKINAAEYKAILDKASTIGVNSVAVNRYYGGRNKIQDDQVSFDYDPDAGNKVLDKIYAYADKINMPLAPSTPHYWDKKDQVEWNPENIDKGFICHAPWTNLHFNPVLDKKECHYVGVCNRIELFELHYDQTHLDTQKQFDKLWNHPILQYLRKTVNAADNINPICKYCKNHNRETIRNVDAQQYAKIRDKAVKDFFDEFRKRYSFADLESIRVLSENPHSDLLFQDKLKVLEM